MVVVASGSLVPDCSVAACTGPAARFHPGLYRARGTQWVPPYVLKFRVIHSPGAGLCPFNTLLITFNYFYYF